MDKSIQEATKSTEEPENKMDDCEPPPKKKNCRWRKTNPPSWTNKFDKSWLEMPIFKGWLEEAASVGNRPRSSKKITCKNASFCKICKSTLRSHEAVLRNHAKTIHHKRNAARLAENAKTTSSLPISTLTKNIRRAALKLCGLIVTDNLPFSLLDSLTPLIQDILPDSEIAEHLSLDGAKCAVIITEIIGKCFLEKLYSKLREPGCFFSLIPSPLTGDSPRNLCAYSVRYYDIVKSGFVTFFFDILEIQEDEAELLKALKKSLVDKNIPLSNLVASSKGINLVKHNSLFFTLLKNEVPNILCVNCSCHMTLLAVAHACSKLPISVGNLLGEMINLLRSRPPRTDQLSKIHSFFKQIPERVLFRKLPGWLSTHYFVNNILEQFQSLKVYIEQLSFEEASETTGQILSTMEDPFTKVYLEFMTYVHSLMTGFNAQFQSKKPPLHKMKLKTAELLKTVCSNFIKIEVIKENDIFELYHKKSDNFVKLQNIYIGVAAQQSLQKLTVNPDLHQGCNEFLGKILEFYTDLVTNIKNYYVFDDPVHDLLLLLYPNIAQSFQETSLKGVIDRFPILNEFVKIQQLDNEWRHHALLDFKKLNLDSISDPEVYWENIFQMKNDIGEELFPNLKKVVHFLFLLTFSNTCVESNIFKDLSKIKFNAGTSSDSCTLKAILASKQGIEQNGGCVEFEPESDMINSNIWHEKFD